MLRVWEEAAARGSVTSAAARRRESPSREREDSRVLLSVQDCRPSWSPRAQSGRPAEREGGRSQAPRREREPESNLEPEWSAAETRVRGSAELPRREPESPGGGNAGVGVDGASAAGAGAVGGGSAGILRLGRILPRRLRGIFVSRKRRRRSCFRFTCANDAGLWRVVALSARAEHFITVARAGGEAEYDEAREADFEGTKNHGSNDSLG